MSRALFVCIQNAGRSQMAQALFERAAGGRHEARSAGSRPAAHVHPEVVDAMREIGVDLAYRTPRLLAPADMTWADVVVTMGCGDACPYVPGGAMSTGSSTTRAVSHRPWFAGFATRSRSGSIS